MPGPLFRQFSQYFCIFCAVVSPPALSLTLLTEHSLEGNAGRGSSRLAQVTWDGRYVLVETGSSSLIGAAGSGDAALVVYDRRQQTVNRINEFHLAGDEPTVSSGDDGNFAISQNGRYVFGVRQSAFRAIGLRYDRGAKLLSVLASRVGDNANRFRVLGYTRPTTSMTGLQSVFGAVDVSIGVSPPRAFLSGQPGETAIVREAGQLSIAELDLKSALAPRISPDGQYLFYRDDEGVNFRRTLSDGTDDRIGRGVVYPSATSQRVFLFQLSREPARLLMVEPSAQRVHFIADGNLSQVAAPLGGQSVFYLLDETLFIWQRHTSRSTELREGVSGELAVSPGGEYVAIVENAKTLSVINSVGRVLDSVSVPEGSAIEHFHAADTGVAMTIRGPVPGFRDIPQDEQNVYFRPVAIRGALSSIRLVIEEPQQGSVSSGVATIRGWALGQSEPLENVSLSIDGQSYGLLPLGGPREDVAAAFPSVAQSTNAGFSAAFGFNELTPGYHRMVVTATSGSGETLSQSVDFVTEPVSREFIVDPSFVSLSSASAQIESEGLIVRNVSVDGRMVDLVMKWQSATQSFELVEVSTEGLSLGNPRD